MSTAQKADQQGLRSNYADQRVILIAEDDAIVANVARIALEKEGYFILTARDGEEALSVSREYSGPIHLVLSDIKMPKLDGLELRQQILTLRPEIKVLMMTGETEPVGKMPLLRKPFSPKELRQTVRLMLEQDDEAQFSSV